MFGTGLYVFVSLKESGVHDIVSWNVLIVGYVQIGEGSIAITYFKRRKCDHFLPNIITFVFILKAC